MFENPRRGRQARNFTTNVPKILDLKSSSEQIFSRKLSLGAPAMSQVVRRHMKPGFTSRFMRPRSSAQRLQTGHTAKRLEYRA